MKITTHSIVKNEDQWVWYAINSVRDQVSEMLVVDDHSIDRTAEIIRTITDPKIKFSSTNLATPVDLTNARNHMVSQTKTDWFLLLDGDEIWNKATLSSLLALLPTLPKSVLAVAMRTRNCVGDVYHYQPETAGKYEILGRKGHLTMRAYRKVPGYSWQDEYPLEKYADKLGNGVNAKSDQIVFFEGFYWHTTHLKRSSSEGSVKAGHTRKNELGIKIKSESELPEVFFQPRPAIVPDPLKKRTLLDTTVASLVTPIKYLRRRLHE